MSLLKSCGAIALFGLFQFSDIANGAEVSAFFKPQDKFSPSYVYTTGDRAYFRVNKSSERFLFTMHKGVITKALVEKWYPFRRMTVTYVLKNKRYAVDRVYSTNLAKFYTLGTDLTTVENSCNKEESSTLNDMSDIILTSAKEGDYIDSSCDVLPKKEKSELLVLRNFTLPSSKESKDLQSCFNKLGKSAKTNSQKELALDLSVSYAALLKKEQSELSSLTLACGQSDNLGESSVGGSSLPRSGRISISTKNGKLINKGKKLKASYMHELIHHLHPLGTGIQQEEDVASAVAEICLNNKLDPEDAGNGPTDSEPAPTDIADMLGGEWILPDPSLPESEATLSSETVVVQAALPQVPEQKLKQSAIDDVQLVAKASNKNNATNLNTAFETVVSGPTQTFSAATDRIASAVLPRAVASETSGGGGSYTRRTGSGSESSSRGPASEADIKGSVSLDKGRNLKAMSAASNKETIVEEILVQNKKGTGLAKYTNYPKNTFPQQSIAANPESAPGPGVPALAGTNSPGAVVATSAPIRGVASVSTGTTTLGSVGGGGPASPRRTTNGTRASAGSSSSGNRNIAEVGGIAFRQANIEGSGYQTYLQNVTKPGFKTSLESAGILIARSGELISKPKEVSATYVDNGSALIYGGF